ncbi:MAG: transcription antitermination factor NusB [Dongiaceae bacterium]
MADKTGAPRRRPGGPSPRRAARLSAVQALYQMNLSQIDVETVIGEFVGHRLGREIDGESYGQPDPVLFADLVRGVVAAHDDLDNMIAAVLDEDWTVERLETILRAVLRAGAYELSSRPDVPPRVTITEYVDLADAFLGAKQAALVNGVLDRIARALRPDELESRKGGHEALTP